MRNWFLYFLRKYGEDVTVTYETPELDADGVYVGDNERGKTTTVEKDKKLRAAMIRGGSSRRFFTAFIGDDLNDKALFKLTDKAYIENEGTTLEDMDGTKYKLEKIRRRKTHFEVNLVNIELGKNPIEE